MKSKIKKLRSYHGLMIILSIILLFSSNILAYQVESGSKGNSIRLEITNSDPSQETKNIEITVIEAPSWVQNITPITQSISNFESETSKTITINFDILENIKIGTEESIILSLTSETGDQWKTSFPLKINSDVPSLQMGYSQETEMCCKWPCINMLNVLGIGHARDAKYKIRKKTKWDGSEGGKVEKLEGGVWKEIGVGEEIDICTFLRTVGDTWVELERLPKSDRHRKADNEPASFWELIHGTTTITEAGLCEYTEHCGITTYKAQAYVYETVEMDLTELTDSTVFVAMYDSTTKIVSFVNKECSFSKIATQPLVGPDVGDTFFVEPGEAITYLCDGSHTTTPPVVATIDPVESIAKPDSQFSVCINFELDPPYIYTAYFLITFDSNILDSIKVPTFTGTILKSSGWDLKWLYNPGTPDSLEIWLISGGEANEGLIGYGPVVCWEFRVSSSANTGDTSVIHFEDVTINEGLPVAFTQDGYLIVNRRPEFVTVPPETMHVTEMHELCYTVEAFDPDGDSLIMWNIVDPYPCDGAQPDTVYGRGSVSQEWCWIPPKLGA